MIHNTYTRCCRCGRTLTNPTSRHYGCGPDCRKKILHALAPSPDNVHYIDFPTPDIVLIRIDTVPRTNVKITSRPDCSLRIDWGNTGSESQSLAYHILRHTGCTLAECEDWHRSFCRSVVAMVRHEGAMISHEDLQKWVQSIRHGGHLWFPCIYSLPSVLEKLV